MAIIVKSAIKINKGFDTWAAMVKSQDDRLGEMGVKFLFAGTEKDDPTQLHAIMMFPSMEVLQAFGADEELTEIRRQGGAIIETGVMTPISEDYFTNYPDAFMKHWILNFKARISNLENNIRAIFIFINNKEKYVGNINDKRRYCLRSKG